MDLTDQFSCKKIKERGTFPISREKTMLFIKEISGCAVQFVPHPSGLL